MAVNCRLVLIGIEAEPAGEMVIDFTFAAAPVTDTVANAYTLPLCAVMVVVPELRPLASPFALTEAMLLSEELQVAELLTSDDVPSENFAVATNCWLAPVPIDVDAGDSCSEEMVEVLFCVPFVCD
jgi:hypothetical protein